MATCSINLTDILLGCDFTRGGIKDVYVASRNAVKASVARTSDNKNITIATAADGEWKKFEFRKATGSMTSTYTIEANGVKYVTTDLVMQFAGINDDTTNALNEIVKYDDLVCIVNTNAGKHIFLGETEPVVATTSTMETGTAFGDLNGYNLTVQDTSNQYPVEVRSTDWDRIDEAVNSTEDTSEDTSDTNA